MEKKKVLLVASPGGHFVQLSLLAEGLSGVRIDVASTYAKKPSFMIADNYVVLPDFNRDTFYRIFSVVKRCKKILRKVRPDLVVTTGAAPGLVMVATARLSGIETLWIDSLANSRRLSLSGKIVNYMGTNVLSQWKKVALKSGVRYEGRVI